VGGDATAARAKEEIWKAGLETGLHTDWQKAEKQA
jgi:hypothetical protein